MNGVAIYAPFAVGFDDHSSDRCGGAERDDASRTLVGQRRGSNVAHIVFEPNEPLPLPSGSNWFTATATQGTGPLSEASSSARRLARAPRRRSPRRDRRGTSRLGIAALFCKLHCAGSFPRVPAMLHGDRMTRSTKPERYVEFAQALPEAKTEPRAPEARP
jgi:hypothetical protein